MTVGAMLGEVLAVASWAKTGWTNNKNKIRNHIYENSLTDFVPLEGLEPPRIAP